MTTQSIGCSFSNIKPFLALSRTTHGFLDMSTPLLCALLALGAVPSYTVIILGLITAFSGYTAIYALNDIVSYREDREKMSAEDNHQAYAVEAGELRHPIAQGVLSLKAGVTWCVFWLSLALIAGYFLNPIVPVILLAGGILEVVYCRLFTVSSLRIFVSGLVKACGPVAAVFAVTPSPDPLFVGAILLWIMLFEIGGQNIPADWNDVEEDKRLNAKTIPVQFGPNYASWIILLATSAAVIVSFVPLMLSSIGFSVSFLVLNACLGGYLLLRPAYSLFRTKESRYATSLFNYASYYPLAIFCLTGLQLVMRAV